MMRVPDEAALAAMRVLSRRLGRRVGGSTGTNFFGLCTLLASRMKAQGTKGALVTLTCDSGERYGHTYYSDEWIAAQGFTLAPHEQALDAFLDGKAASLG
jgi:cysteine synthase A